MSTVIPVTHLDRQALFLAVALAAQAGFVDALGFMASGGFFVSFMSGNSTRLAVGVVDQVSAALFAGGLILTFVCGVFIGSLARMAMADHRKLIGSLILLTVCLLVAASLHQIGQSDLALFTLAFAMGAENTVFERDGDVAVGLTYMTGALVKLGQRLAFAISGKGAPFAWLPFLGLWSGLVAGAILGAKAHSLWGLDAIWGAVALTASLTLWRVRLIRP